MDTFYGDNRTSAHFSGLILSKYIPPTFYSNNTNGKSLMYKNCPVSLALVLVVGHVSLLLKSSDTHHDQDNSPLNCAANHDLASGLKGENTTINKIEVTPSGLTSQDVKHRERRKDKKDGPIDTTQNGPEARVPNPCETKRPSNTQDIGMNTPEHSHAPIIYSVIPFFRC